MAAITVGISWSFI